MVATAGHRAALRLLDPVPAHERPGIDLRLRLGLGTALAGARGFGTEEVRLGGVDTNADVLLGSVRARHAGSGR